MITVSHGQALIRLSDSTVVFVENDVRVTPLVAVTAPDDEPAVAEVATSQEVEERELDRVTQTLQRAFPNVRTRVVRHAVRQAQQGFAGSPIRDFVPLLVERAAREALIQQTGQLPVQAHASPLIGGTGSAADGPLDGSF